MGSAVGTDVTLKPTLAATSYQEKYLEMFWDLYYPPGAASEAGILRAYAAGTWTSVARDLYRDRPYIRMLLLAHCLATVGRSERERWLMLESLKFYTAAVGRVRKELLRPNAWKDDSVVVASRALASYEILYGQEHTQGQTTSSQARSWQAYNAGDETLLLARGPWMHQEGSGFNLFVDGRMQLLISATVRRKSTFLAEETWKTVPWIDKDKSSRDRLLDVTVDLPGLLEQLDILRVCAAPSQDMAGKFLQLLIVIDEGLTAWYESEAPVTHLEELLARGIEHATRGDFAVVEIMSIYWTTCVLTYSALQLATRSLPGVVSSHLLAGRLAEQPRSNPRQYCKHIAGSVGAFFQPSAGGMFSKSAAFPVSIALGYLTAIGKLDSPEAQVLLGYLATGDHGRAIGAFVKGTVREWGPGFSNFEAASPTSTMDGGVPPSSAHMSQWMPPG